MPYSDRRPYRDQGLILGAVVLVLLTVVSMLWEIQLTTAKIGRAHV